MADENDELLNAVHGDPKPDASQPAGGAEASAGAASESKAAATGPADSQSSGSTPDSEDAVGLDDLLDPNKIEALLDGADGGQASSGSPFLGSGAGPGSGAGLGPGAGGGIASGSGAESLINQAEADLAAAIAPELNPQAGLPSDFMSAAPFEFQEFDSGAGDNSQAAGLDALDDVELDLCIELGRTELLIEEVLKLKQGSVVPLDKLAGDPVDILVNGRLVARGEVLVLNDNFCVRVAEILAPDL